MRDLLDLLQQLNESTGLAGRKPGDIFRNAQGDEMSFNDIQFFPTGGGKFEPEQLDMALQKISQSINDIQWQNARTPRTGGFALINFSTPTGELNVGRYLEKVKPDIKDNFIPNKVGEYDYKGKSAEKVQAKLTPQDLLTAKDKLTIPQIMNELAKSLGTDNPLYAVAHKIAIGESLPIEFDAPTDVSFTAFRDYFCEILQPMALQKGQYTGNAGEAAEKFLGRGGFSKTTISFDDSKNAGLSDSIMTNLQGASVAISSKGGKGATASVNNLLDKVNQLEKTEGGQQFLKPYTEIVSMLREIKARGQAGSPLYLGTKYNIISAEDAKEIANLKEASPINMANINKLGLSDNLVKLAVGRNTDSPKTTNLYYHLIAAVAHKTAEVINEKTNFSEAAADILNNGGLIQMYTKAKQNKDKWVLNEFDTVYPGESIKGVYLSAGKTYYSTGIKGNFTFKIDKGSGKPKEEEIDTEVVSSMPSDDLASAAQDITGAKRKPKAVSSPGSNVGRSKRK